MSSPLSEEESPPQQQQEASEESPPPAEVSRQRSKAISDVTWDDIVEDDKGQAFSIIGYELTLLTSNQLRTVASTRLELKELKNAKKSVMIDAIKAKHTLLKGYTALDNAHKQQQESQTPGSTATRKEAQCTFRLVNLLFSDTFAEDFSNTGCTPTREAIDRGLVASNNKAFWDRVRHDFVNEIDEYHLMELDEEDKQLFNELGGDIDPGKIVPHSSKKLRDAIWKDLNSEYKRAMHRFTTSGEHNSNFFDYCYGKLDTYYLYKKLQKMRPGLNNFVLAELPESCAVESDDFLDGNKSVASSTANTSKKQKRRNSSGSSVNSVVGSVQIASAIRETYNANALGEAQFLQHRVSFMMAEEERRKGEEVRKNNEEARREKEDARKDSEETRCANEVSSGD